MKWLFIITLAMLCLGVNKNVFAEIKNGYDHELIAAQIRINNLNAIAKEHLNKEQRKRLKKCLKSIHKTVEKLKIHQALTQALVEKFRQIDPDLYHEINIIQDSEGNETDVYVKVVDHLGSNLEGTTNVAHSLNNPNIYTSEYSDYSVSIKIRQINTFRNLQTLAHELGHVRYQVPHLATYVVYYKQTYQGNKIIGHFTDDPSHQSVKTTLHAFLDSWRKNNRAIREMAHNKYRKILASKQED